MKKALSAGLLPAFLFLCLLFGGASAAGLLANAFLQLLAVLILFAAVAVRPETPLSRPARQLLLLLALLIGLVLLQLIPLPPAIWTLFPGRDHVREGFELVGRPLPWLPISLAPSATLASILWLLPAIAMLVGMLRIGARESWIGWAMILVTALSVLIGAMQITGGEDSRWYFYAITNYGVTVGFFANANHLATLLVCTVPFLGALYMVARGKGRAAQRSAGLFVILAGFLGLVLVGLVINGSLAGLGLMLPVTGATALMMMRRRKVPVWALALVVLLTLGSVAAVFSGRFDNNLINEDASTSVVSRHTTFTTSFEAIKDYFPLGSGVGSFQPIYRLYENAALVDATYINHVHSDWIEVVLETGLPGIVLLVLFMIWWVRRTAAIWRSPEPDYIARAASIATAAILAHSLVDYPLRTVAISAVFAACLALMADRRVGAARGGKRWPTKRPTRHLSAD